jgi:multidrug/hemolysin transport system permease protein
MKTQNAFGLLSTLVGTFIGFLGGIYIQVGLLPQTVQYVMSVLPVSHSVTLIRKIYMGQALDLFFVDQSIPQYQEFLTDMGLEVNVFGHVMSSFEMVVSLIGFGLLFYVLSVLKLSKSKL